MAKRMQLNDEQVEQVTGGAFNFYTSKEGQRLVYVDGVGTFLRRECFGNKSVR